MSALAREPSSIGWRFWVAWILAAVGSAIVYVIAMLPVGVLMSSMLLPNSDPGAMGILLPVVSIGSKAALGAFFGLGQWLVLRRYLPGAGLWVLATAIGYFVPLSFGSSMIQFVGLSVLGPLSMGVAFGIALGVLQWLVLWGSVYQAGWWILITLTGWVLAFGLTGALYLGGLYIEPMDMLFAFLVPVAVSGAGMVWLLRRTVHHLVRTGKAVPPAPVS